MNTYPSYKDSGVEWIGEIPIGWDTKRFSYSFNIQKGKIPRKLINEPLEKSLPYLSMEVLRGKNPSEYSNEDGLVIVQNGDIGLLWDGSNSGEVVRINREGILSSTVSLLSLKDTNLKKEFSFYLLKFYEDDYKNNTIGMGIPHVDGNHVKESKLIIPSIDEQTQIVSFLDTKTQKVDELIEKTEQKIKLLKEKRTSLINHCVTKGLNPDVKMKDSGVEWIGEIPRDWKLLKFWLIISSSDLGGNYNCSSEYEGYPVMKMGNLGRGSINLKKIEYIDNNSNVDKNHILQNGDFLFNTRNSKELVGKVSLWKNELPISIYNSNILRICFNKNVSNDYMNYLFNSNSILDFLKMISKGTTNVSGIYFKDLSNIYICLPSKHEQTQIVEYLDEQTQNIDSTIEKETQRIELLKEYRQSLISEVVTGKVDVRDYNG